ncbi:MAG: hypothetical protein C0601_09160 [Candidatus Muiribacterium halophilum]|uniref:Adenylate/guanylate cyclase domain-containing protein n=1 Tax=Muiribacterium halophilum TaxID=2053465 RepID=A0A2N5ZDU7_MUIH1|nr:MAG: hypothetical protein C0601_09160 [Candidatus Muirbacterium halophilum]
MRKIWEFIKKLHIPLYIFLFLAIYFGFTLTSMLEFYQKIDINKFINGIEENKELINQKTKEAFLIDDLAELRLANKEFERLKKEDPNNEKIPEFQKQITQKREELKKLFNQRSQTIEQYAKKYSENIEKRIQEKEESRKKETKKLGLTFKKVENPKHGLNIDINGDERIVRKLIPLIKKSFDKREERIRREFPGYGRKNLVYLFPYFLIFWLFPVYRYNFGFEKYSNKVKKRIVNLPFVILVMSWVISLIYFGVRAIYLRKFIGSYNDSIFFTLFQSFLVFGSLFSFLNITFLESYIRNRIALPVFEKNDLHSVKEGLSVNLYTRLRLMMFALGVVPIVITFIILLVFNINMIKSVFTVSDMENLDITKLIYSFFPFVFVTVSGIFFMIPIVIAIFLMRSLVQKPISKLVKRMREVAQGDFSNRASVLSNDEIGILRGHFNSMVEGLAEREKIRDTFGKYVSMEIAEKLIKEGGVELEGEEIETTVMFTDIRNFTPLSEKMKPRAVIDFLNKYFSYMCKPILDENGVINKFIGDSIMAVFSPVFGNKDHADSALRAAIMHREALDEFNKTEGYPTVRHGIGLHTGILIAGNVGTDERMEYTVIGDTVNIASRVESQTKVFNEDILISEPFYKKINKENFKDYEFIPFEPVLVKGKTNEMVLYSVKKKEKNK